MWKWIIGAMVAALAAMAGIGVCVWEVGRDDDYFEKQRHR